MKIVRNRAKGYKTESIRGSKQRYLRASLAGALRVHAIPIVTAAVATFLGCFARAGSLYALKGRVGRRTADTQQNAHEKGVSHHQQKP